MIQDPTQQFMFLLSLKMNERWGKTVTNLQTLSDFIVCKDIKVTVICSM